MKDLTFQEVPVKSFSYIDCTGYATHVFIEFEQYLEVAGRRRILSVPMTLKLHGGCIDLQHPALRQMISVVVQPFISQRPSERELLGAPYTYNAAGGSYISQMAIATVGTTVPRTRVTAVTATRPNPNAPTPFVPFHNNPYIVIDEVPPGPIHFQDPSDTIRWVRWTFSATQQGLTSTFQQTHQVTPSSNFVLDLQGFEDVTTITCEAFTDPKLLYPFGGPTTISSSSPGLFLQNAQFVAVEGPPEALEVISFTESAPPVAPGGMMATQSSTSTQALSTSLSQSELVPSQRPVSEELDPLLQETPNQS